MAHIAISKARVLANSASGAFTLLINVGFVFWLYQYLLARVPAEEFAIYPVLMVIMMLGPVIVSFFASAISRETIVAYADDRKDDVQVLHSSTVLALGVFLGVLVLLGILGATQIEHLLNVPTGMLSEVRLMAVIVVVDLCTGLFAVPFSTAFEVRQRFMWRDMITLAVNFFKIALTFAFLFGLGPSVLWVTLASLIASLIGLTAIVICARRMLPEFRIKPEKFSLDAIHGVLRFGAWTSLGSITTLIYQSAGPVLLNIFSTPAQVTIFFIGTVFDRRIGSLMTVALAPVQPSMVAMSVSGDWSKLGNTYLRAGRYALWVSMAIATPIFIFADDFIDLYLGPGYEDAATVMRLFLIGVPVGYADVLLSRVAIATGHIRLYFGGSAVISLLALVGIVIGLKTSDAGAVGVAVAISVIAISGHLVFFWPLGLSLARVRFSDFALKVLARGLTPAAGGLLVWVPCEMLGFSQTWAGFFLCGLVGSLIYVAVLLKFCLAPDERRGLRTVLDRLRRRSTEGS
jgi:O-antigen/teichoic acid export membrane protein